MEALYRAELQAQGDLGLLWWRGPGFVGRNGISGSLTSPGVLRTAVRPADHE
jgi:hypothetical protein